MLGHGHDPKTEHMAKLLVDHAMANGWDETCGGFLPGRNDVREARITAEGMVGADERFKLAVADA